MMRDASVPSRLLASLCSAVTHIDIDLGGNAGIEQDACLPLGRLCRVAMTGDEHRAAFAHDCTPATLAEEEGFKHEIGRFTEQPALPGFH
mmetsp:Transcript_102740/g.204015  ORF Transcript_102740/g.204015 Transcript_102740/m.204015 type:complete len:90 (-) Transcript_102740:178-447(-)